LEHLDFGFVSDFDIRYSDLVAANGRAKHLERLARFAAAGSPTTTST